MVSVFVVLKFGKFEIRRLRRISNGHTFTCVTLLVFHREKKGLLLGAVHKIGHLGSGGGGYPRKTTY